MTKRVRGGVELLVVALFAALVAVLAVPLVPNRTDAAVAPGSSESTTPQE